MDERETQNAEEQERMSTDIEGALMDGLDDDPRLGHGVPSHLRGSDLDFIQMSGLTVTSDGEEPDVPEPDEDLDPNVPVSFYEEGIDDVDSRRAPLGTEPEAGSADEVIVPRARTQMSSSIASLKEIVADLAAREAQSRAKADMPAEDPDRVAGSHEEAHPPHADSIVVPEDNLPAPEPDPPAADSIVVPEDNLPAAEPDPPRDTQSSAAASPDTHSPLRDLGPLPEEDLAEEMRIEEEKEPEPKQAPVSDPEVMAVAPQAEVPRRPDLAQAESLLQRLEAQAASQPEPDGDDEFDMPEIPEATVHDGESSETDESVYNRPNAPTRRYSKRRRMRRRMMRAMGLLALLAALGAGGLYGYTFYHEQTATDADHYRAAMRLAERGQHRQAGVAFAAFSQRYPESALGGDALLMAAHSLERAGDDSAAVTYYERFRIEYSEHPKYHRATTLLALALVRNAEYERAITLLQDPELRTLDPDGYLASLRALGESHAALGQIDEARSAYLRAASLEGNYTADEDYLALARLYQSQADQAADAESRSRYLSLAVDQWDFAMRSPGITESRRRDIKARRDLVISELGNVALSDGAAAPSDQQDPVPAPDDVKADAPEADESMEEETDSPQGASDTAEGASRDYEQEQAQLMNID